MTIAPTLTLANSNTTKNNVNTDQVVLLSKQVEKAIINAPKTNPVVDVILISVGAVSPVVLAHYNLAKTLLNAASEHMIASNPPVKKIDH